MERQEKDEAKCIIKGYKSNMLTLNIRDISFLLTEIKSEGQTELTEKAPSLKKKQDTESEQNHLKENNT